MKSTLSNRSSNDRPSGKRVRHDSNTLSDPEQQKVVMHRSQSSPIRDNLEKSSDFHIARMLSCPPVFFRGHNLLKKARQTLERQPSLARDAVFTAWNPTASFKSLVDTFTSLPPTKSIIEDIEHSFSNYELDLSHGDANESICDVMLDTLSKRLYELKNTGEKDEILANYFSGFNKLLAEKNTIQRILKLILNDNVALERIAKGSYSHDNGFDKYVFSSRSGWRMRLHVWW